MSSIIDSALDLYRKYKLKKELMEEAAMETEDDIKEAMSDFGDYQNIIDRILVAFDIKGDFSN